ncbi:MAG: cpdA 2 [Gammaproteobacteria bacterium]|nr:cpdA 2 [Gammaproteobacteria bacterium]
MLKQIRYALIILTLLVTHSVFAQTPSTKKFISISDIHFNPFIGCNQFSTPCPILTELRNTDPTSWDNIFEKYADKIETSYHQDTDFFLLQSTLTELNTLTQRCSPAFMVILGDFLAHKFREQYQKYSGDLSIAGYQAFVRGNFEYLTHKLNQAMPITDIYPALGNNDSYGQNYEVDPHGFFLHDLRTIFSALIKNKTAKKEFQNEFANGGYYAVTLPQKNQRLIVLNSVLFSALYHTSAMQQAAEEQLAWLQLQLSTAQQRQQKVLLALHIPPGVDIYLSLKLFSSLIQAGPPLFWQDSYNKQFLSLLQQYANTVVAILAGHIHSDAFQLIANKAQNSFIPVSFTSSISPMNGNNPGLKVFTYASRTFELVNFHTYFYPINEGKSARWKKEYDFNSVYQPDCQSCSVINGMLQLTKDNILENSYVKYYNLSNSTQSAIQHNWLPYYWCGIYNMDWQSYQVCLNQ